MSATWTQLDVTYRGELRALDSLLEEKDKRLAELQAERDQLAKERDAVAAMVVAHEKTKGAK